MHTATLMDINPASGVCTYKLSGCGYYDPFIFGKDRKELEVFSREGFTKISLNGREVVKTLGVMSHKNVLRVDGFAMNVPANVLARLTDDQLLRLAVEFEFTGDDLTAVSAELNNR